MGLIQADLANTQPVTECLIVSCCKKLEQFLQRWLSVQSQPIALASEPLQLLIRLLLQTVLSVSARSFGLNLPSSAWDLLLAIFLKVQSLLTLLPALPTYIQCHPPCHSCATPSWSINSLNPVPLSCLCLSYLFLVLPCCSKTLTYLGVLPKSLL